MVFHPKVKDRVIPGTTCGRPCDHQKRRRLPSSNVSSLGLGGVEGDEEPPCELPLGRGIGMGHRAPYRGLGHQVGLGGEPVANNVARLGDAPRPGVCHRPALAVDKANLAPAGTAVTGQQSLESVLGAPSGAHQFQPERPIGGVRQRLGGNRTDAGLGPRDHRADREPMRLHRNAQITGLRVTSHYRICHRRRQPWMIVIEEITASSSGCSPRRGRRAIASTASMPEVTLPKMV